MHCGTVLNVLEVEEVLQNTVSEVLCGVLMGHFMVVNEVPVATSSGLW